MNLIHITYPSTVVRQTLCTRNHLAPRAVSHHGNSPPFCPLLFLYLLLLLVAVCWIASWRNPDDDEDWTCPKELDALNQQEVV